MQRLIAVLIPLALFGSGFAGCLGTGEEPPCWEIPIPKDGSTVKREASYRPEWENKTKNLTVNQVPILRADGHVVQGIKMTWESEEANLFSMNGNPLGVSIPGLGVEYMALDGMRFPPLLFGRCLAAGDELQIPFRDGLRYIDVEVIIHHPTLQVEMVIPGGQLSPWQGNSNKTYLDRLEWVDPGSPFPDKMEDLNISDPDDGPSRIQRFTEYVAGTTSEGRTEKDRPLAMVRPSRANGCENLPGRHPDLNALPTHPRATFEAYRDNMSRDAALQKYLDDQPRACAVYTSYVVVNESSNKTTNYAPPPPEAIQTSSTAYVWTSILTDQDGERFKKRWVVRCYHDAALVVLYGECTEHPHYWGNREWEGWGRGQGPSIDTAGINSEIGLSQVLENLDRLTEAEFQSFVWRTHVMAQPTRGVLSPRISDDPGPAFDFGYFESRMSVDYVGPDGPEPGGGRTGGPHYIIFWQSGLAYVAEGVELRKP